MLFLFSSLLINFGRICQSLLPFNPELTDFSDLTLSDKLISNVCFFNASTYWKYLFVKQFRDKSLLKLFVYFGKSDFFFFKKASLGIVLADAKIRKQPEQCFH